MQQLVACVLLGCHVLCACWACGCGCGCKMTDDTSRNTRVIPVVKHSSNPPNFLFLLVATAVQCPHQLKPSNTQTHTYRPGSRAGAPVCQRDILAVAVFRYSWCRAVGFIRAAVSCGCAVGLSCAVCVLAMYPPVWLQNDR